MCCRHMCACAHETQPQRRIHLEVCLPVHDLNLLRVPVGVEAFTAVSELDVGAQTTAARPQRHKLQDGRQGTCAAQAVAPFEIRTLWGPLVLALA
jgi:hypothetical protein